MLFNTLTLQHDAEFVSSYPSFVLDSALSVLDDSRSNDA